MKRMHIVCALLAAALLAACTQAPAAVGSPSPENPAIPTPYPGPDMNSQAGEDPYPGPDAPVNSDDPTTPGPYPDPLQPIEGEETMERGEVFIDESGIIILESMPPQYTLRIAGNLPTPCHYLRAQISEPDEQNQIRVEVYSLINPEEICAQVLKPFVSSIPLGSFPTGKYSVLVNGEMAGEIDAP